MTSFVADENFLDNYLTNFFEYNSWYLNIVAFFSAENF